MASGPLRFRTPFIEELPTTQSRQAPGFAWVAVAGPSADPAKNWGTTNRKRARNAGLGQSDSQREALSARQQREIERKIRELNSDTVRGDGVAIPAAKKDGSGSVGGGGQVKAGKTPNTKKILASGKTFAHYLDDEEAEIARTGKRDIEGDGPSVATAAVVTTQRASKTPLARRKPPQDTSATASPGPSSSTAPPALQKQEIPSLPEEDPMDVDGVNDPLPTQADLEALINALPLTYNQARSQPPPAGAPPPRKFCEICGYWGRVKCMKCGNMTCSVMCKDAHDENKCLKFYA